MKRRDAMIGTIAAVVGGRLGSAKTADRLTVTSGAITTLGPSYKIDTDEVACVDELEPPTTVMEITIRMHVAPDSREALDELVERIRSGQS